MERQPKPWGRTTPIIRDPLYHVDRIAVEPGGHCSIHRHLHKSNAFHVLSGALLVVRFTQVGGVGPHTWMTAGNTYTLYPGWWHQFWTKIGAEALEVYLPATENPVDVADIERHPQFSEGGILDYNMLTPRWHQVFKPLEIEVPALQLQL